MTVPLLPQLCTAGPTARDHWRLVERLLAHPIPKGTHWGFYDIYRLERQKGLKVRKWRWDSYLLHHLFDPADEHRLAYCASIDLDYRYWKHESKWDRKALSKELKANWHMRHRYRGIDVGTTWHEIAVGKQKVMGAWEPTWLDLTV